MNATTMLRSFCDAVEQRNGAAFAALFTEDGVYHDVFYGAFAGREKIAAHSGAMRSIELGCALAHPRISR